MEFFSKRQKSSIFFFFSFLFYVVSLTKNFLVYWGENKAQEKKNSPLIQKVFVFLICLSMFKNIGKKIEEEIVVPKEKNK